jgi:hypothetical protein
MVQKYLFPHLKPPTLTAYEADKEALATQFDAAEQLLKEIQSETQVMKTNIEEQRAKVEAAVQDVTAAVEEMRKGEEEVRDEMREIRTEVNNMQEMLPKVRNLQHHTKFGLKLYAHRCWIVSETRRECHMGNYKQNSSPSRRSCCRVGTLLLVPGHHRSFRN